MKRESAAVSCGDRVVGGRGAGRPEQGHAGQHRVSDGEGCKRAAVRGGAQAEGGMAQAAERSAAFAGMGDAERRKYGNLPGRPL